MVVFAILLPTVDPVSLLFETIPLLILFEASIWMAKVMEPRWRGGPAIIDDPDAARRAGTSRGEDRLADWVVPVEGSPIRDGAIEIADDGTIAAVGAAADLGRGEHHEGCVILPGFVNAHSHIEYAVYAGFGDGLPFSAWIGMHVQRKAELDYDDMVAIATVGAHECLRSGITTIGDCSFSGAAAVGAATAGLRAIVYLEVFGRDASALDRFHESHARIEQRVLGPRPARRLTPRAVHLHDRVYRACAELGLPQATHFAESAAERDWLVAGRGRLEPLRRHARPAARGDRDPPARGRGPARPEPDGGPLRVRRRRGDRAPRGATASASRTAPARTATSAAASRPLEELLDAGRERLDRHRQPRIDAVARPVRGDPNGDRGRQSTRPSGPTRCRLARALELATLGGARVLGMDDRIGSLVPGKQADLTVLSLADSPFDPVEDPVTAAVLGGSPDRVTATLVAGEQRYLKGTSRWPDSTRAARSARSRMLP